MVILLFAHCSRLKCSNQRSMISAKPDHYKLIFYSFISEELSESLDKLWIKRKRLIH